MKMFLTSYFLKNSGENTMSVHTSLSSLKTKLCLYVGMLAFENCNEQLGSWSYKCSLCLRCI